MNTKKVIISFVALAVVSLAAGYFIPIPARVTVIDKTLLENRPSALPENVLKADWFETANYWESNVAYGALLQSKRSWSDSMTLYRELLEKAGWKIWIFSADANYRLIEAESATKEKLTASFLETSPQTSQVRVMIHKQ